MKIHFFIICLCMIAISSCEEKHQIDPQVITVSVRNGSYDKCTAKGLITEKGSYSIIDYGFVCYYGYENSYYGQSSHLSLGNVVPSDTFSMEITLQPASESSTSKYYIRAYVTNQKGTIYAQPVSFEPRFLKLQGISKPSGFVGDIIKIYGSNFDPVPGKTLVTFNNQYSATIISATDSELSVQIPEMASNSAKCSLTVKIGNQQKSLYDIFTLLPTVRGFSPNSGTFGTNITVMGSSLYQCSVYLNSQKLDYVSNYSNNTLSFSIPSTFTSKRFKIYIVKDTYKVEVPGGEFIMLNVNPSSFNPTTAISGSQITISGTNFNPNSNLNTIFLGQSRVTATEVSSSSYVKFNVPASVLPGDYKLSVSNGVDTAIVSGMLKVRVPVITGISPSTGTWGTEISIFGHHLIDVSSVSLNNTYVYPTHKDTSACKFIIPNLPAGTYNVFLKTGTSQYKSPVDLVISNPTFTSISPANGSPGTSVVINGAGFGNSIYNVSVKFGSLTAAITSVNNTRINALVPTGLTPGSWVVTVTVGSYTITETHVFTVP